MRQPESKILCHSAVLTLRVTISASQTLFNVIPARATMAVIKNPERRLDGNALIGSGWILKPILGEGSSCSEQWRKNPSDRLAMVVIRAFVSSTIPVGAYQTMSLMQLSVGRSFVTTRMVQSQKLHRNAGDPPREPTPPGREHTSDLVQREPCSLRVRSPNHSQRMRPLVLDKPLSKLCYPYTSAPVCGLGSRMKLLWQRPLCAARALCRDRSLVN